MYAFVHLKSCLSGRKDGRFTSRSITIVIPINKFVLFFFCGVLFTGLQTCSWKGRNQILGKPGVTYYIDGAHTKESLEVLHENILIVVISTNNIFLLGQVILVLLEDHLSRADQQSLNKTDG